MLYALHQNFKIRTVFLKVLYESSGALWLTLDWDDSND